MTTEPNFMSEIPEAYQEQNKCYCSFIVVQNTPCPLRESLYTPNNILVAGNRKFVCLNFCSTEKFLFYRKKSFGVTKSLIRLQRQ